MLSEPIKDLSELVQERPKEHYRFQVDPEKFEVVENAMVSRFVKRAVFILILCLVASVFWLLIDRSFSAFLAGLTLAFLIFNIFFVRLYKKAYAQNKQTFAKTIYDYTLYEDELIIWSSSETKVEQTRLRLSEIKRIRKVGDFVVLERSGLIYLLNKSMLKDDSYFIRMC